jgi:hypothetical protein
MIINAIKSDAAATALAREVIEVARSLEDWALEADGTPDEARTHIALANAVREAMDDARRVWAAYADGYAIPRDEMGTAWSILMNLQQWMFDAVNGK